MSFGENLISRLESLGISRALFAERMGLSRQTVPKREPGVMLPETENNTAYGNVQRNRVGITVQRHRGKSFRGHKRHRGRCS